ncbi:Putative DNA methylase [Fulvivirga imtechensis AK7]|uniref:site-specific DNA-methyltransferase (adenine-specific) n=1 Tax=Fulvivirga imtechensis AK7 TaxID=1237149 RepID=L8JW99_9BACT|nr:site-specific DNA-methyltransferase [Fulvivirga imtechensis]ELR73301.1 Putative DNA methylase [Fulvivirga imtechensis AK7]
MAKKSSPKSIAQYQHSDKERANNPHIGMVNEATETYGKVEKKIYQYDPHLDPQLQWAGKAERTSFEVPTVSLHVHERIDPKTIIEAVKKDEEEDSQLSLFEQSKKPLREAIEFYKHKEGWTNRLISGDSLLVMNSLIEKEGMAGKVQMVYFDPPYGIRYGSNFQPFVNKRDVRDGKDEDLTQEPEMIKAFRDTWELGIHSYLSYLRDRLLLAKELLHERGSIFVQISDENVHHVREIMDEVFGSENFVSMISYVTTTGFKSVTLSRSGDYIIWYGKKKDTIKYKQLFLEKTLGSQGATAYKELENLPVANFQVKKFGAKRLGTSADLTSQGASSTNQAVVFNGIEHYPPSGLHWKTTVEGMKRLIDEGRVFKVGNTLRYLRLYDDFPVYPINNFWSDTGVAGFTGEKVYVVQTTKKVIERCLLMTTDPGDLVVDITCGSGTTAMMAEEWGRRWITCDTSRIAITLTKQRLLTANFDYFKLARPTEGLSGAFEYKTVPHITLKSIANNEPPGEETLYDQPKVDNSITRVTGPFTVESIPAPFVKNLEEAIDEQGEADNSVAKSGETLRQDQWRDELLRTGVRAKGGAMMEFSRIEAQQGTKYIQALAETREENPKNVLVVFGPEHSPMDARLVELALDEAKYLKPDILLFCAFQFDEEAAKDIDETPENLIGFKLLKAQMNMDLQTEDLKKNRNTNQSFWLIGQPDVRINAVEGEKVTVEVAGFDYYNPKTGEVNSGGQKNIAMWMLDTDYDGRSIFPRQVFFPMAGAKEGWTKLAKTLKAEIDEEKIEAYRGTVSLPFKPGKQIAVKIIDDRGIESLKVIKR